MIEAREDLEIARQVGSCSRRSERRTAADPPADAQIGLRATSTMSTTTASMADEEALA